jgi:2,3-bisphosphoglycerate-independent phosphoglycerate mutase
LSGLKVAVLVPDGAADQRREELNGKTPLEAAATPNMDAAAAAGATGLVYTVPSGMPPGSDVANLSLMGYDPATHYGGRGPIEAANLGIDIPEGWTCFRCNLVATDGKRMLDYSAGHISQEDARRLIGALEAKLADNETVFYQGKSYRNIMLVKGDYVNLECTPPHDITEQPVDPYMPRGEGAERIVELMRKSRELFADLPGGASADMIWPWGQGVRMTLEPFGELYGLRGGVISAVDLVCGLGRLAGLQSIAVPGITGYLDTNYRGKGEAAAKALEDNDFIYVHVEAPDEAAHIGSVSEKVKALERFDADVVGPVLEHVRTQDGDFRILICPDHPTFISTRTHDGSPVPYAAFGAGIASSGAKGFSESHASSGGPHFDPGWKLMSAITGDWPA